MFRCSLLEISRTGKQRLAQMISAEVNTAASGEEKPGDIFLPLSCKSTLTANHRAGDQAASSTLSLVEVCHPLAYFAPAIAAVAQRAIAIPKGFHLVSFSAFVFASHLTSHGGTLTIEAIAYLKHNAIMVNAYHSGGK